MSGCLMNEVTMDLAGMASNQYGSGELPIGDQHYVTDAPRKGYIYLCHSMKDGGGAQFAGPWIHGSSWNPNGKPAVEGSVTWGNAQFTNIINGDGTANGSAGLLTQTTTDPREIQFAIKVIW